MATRTVLNDLAFFEGGTVCAEKVVQFKVMSGEVTESKGTGVALISLWNYATGKVDVLSSVEAQYVLDSPFNLLSAVCLEDKYGLYGQLLHRELVSTSGKSRYRLVRDGKIFILPEYVDTEAACPTVQQKVFRDVVSWKFTDFHRWNAEKGPFTVDMCADKHNTQLPEFYSEENSVFDHTLAGRASLGEDLRVEELVYDLDLLVILSDNDSTIIAGQTAEYCRQNSILQRTTAPYLHENNARVESYNRLLQAKARAMLLTGDLCAEKLVLSWDPSVVVPLRSLLNCVQLSAPYFEKFTGSSTLILDIAIYAPPDSDEFTGVVKLQSRSSNKCTTFWAPVSFFLEQCASSLELLKKILNEQTVNRFYPVFAFAKVQLTSGTEWEEAVVCINARGEHQLPYQVLLLRHCGRTGKSVDVAETSIRFQVQHVALAAVQQQWLPNGVTCPKNWQQLVSAPDAVQWQASDYKEECALIDVKHAFVPVKSLPAGVKSLGMKVVYKAKFDAANVLTERKSRWVVFGNKQTHGVNYEEVYSPCTQLNTLRILIQLSLILGLLAFTMDVVTCFLNGDLDLDAPLFVSSPASHTAELESSAYSDADHAADKVTRRSVTGSLVRLNGSTVMYSSKLQKTVVVSTADGELVALSETARDIEHVVNLLSEFAPLKLLVVLHGDNHASVIQAESALNNTATRHISVRDRHVAKLAELGRILIAKVPSAENLAYFFTKPMPTDRFLVLRAIVLRFFRSRSTEE
eukprot:gene7597-biopygen7674